MNLLSALAVGTLFGCGVFLMTRHDLAKLVAGTVLIANAAILLLISAGFRYHVANPAGEELSVLADPLVQALALTAVVINFATTVLLLRVMVEVESSHDTLSTEALARAELEQEHRIEDGPEPPVPPQEGDG